MWGTIGLRERLAREKYTLQGAVWTGPAGERIHETIVADIEEGRINQVSGANGRTALTSDMVIAKLKKPEVTCPTSPA